MAGRPAVEYPWSNHNPSGGGPPVVNAVEIEEAVPALTERPFDPEEFPSAFLEAFGNKEATIKRLRKGE
jgi:hypothetical protein